MKNYIQPETINFNIVALNNICGISNTPPVGDPEPTVDPHGGKVPGRKLYV